MNISSRFGTALLVCITLSILAFGTAEDAPIACTVMLVIAAAGWWINERPRWRGEERSTGGSSLPPHAHGAGDAHVQRGKAKAAGKSPVAPLFCLPRWASLGLLVIIVGIAAYRGYREKDPISAFIWLLASILLLKIWEQRHIRDYGQMLTVSIFLMVGASLADNSVVLGMLVIAQVPVVVWSVMLYQLLSTQERTAARALERSSPPPPTAYPKRHTRAFPSTKAFRRGINLLALVSICFASAAAIATFIFIPRGIGLRQLAGNFGQLNMGRGTSFTDEVDLGQGGIINESFAPVMDVRIFNGFGHDVGGESRLLYLRGAVLDQYGGREWKRSDTVTQPDERTLTPDSPSADLTIKPWRPSQSRRQSIEVQIDRRRLENFRTEPDPSQVLVQRISVRRTAKAETPLFAVWRPRAIKVPDGAVIRFDHRNASLFRQREARFRSGFGGGGAGSGETPAAQGGGDGLEYEVTSVPLCQEDEFDLPAPESDQITFNSPVIAGIASGALERARISPDSAVRPESENLRTARIFEAYLRTTCEYTMDVPIPPLKSDPIEWFLTESKRGHCELFAAALTAMCRSVGIEARFIAGYLASEYDAAASGGGKYIVRQSNAHAWCEVNVGDGRWETMDATPPGTLHQIRESRKSWTAKFAQFFADIRDRWNGLIVSFDAGAQQKLLGATDLSQPWYSGDNTFTAGAAAARKALDAMQAKQRRLFGIAAGATALIAGIWLLSTVRAGSTNAARDKAGWALTRASASGRNSRESRRVYRDLLAACEACGLPKPPWRPLRTHVEEVISSKPELAAAMSGAVDALYGYAFEGKTLSKHTTSSAAAP